MSVRRVDLERPELAELRVLSERLDQLRLESSPLHSGAESGRVSGSAKPSEDQRALAMGRAYQTVRQRIRKLNEDIERTLDTGKLPSWAKETETKPCPRCSVGNWWNNRFCYVCGQPLSAVEGSHDA